MNFTPPKKNYLKVYDMIKIIKAQPVPKEQIECTNCSSILEYENVDLELHQCYMTGYKYRLRCPVCGVFIDAKWIKNCIA